MQLPLKLGVDGGGTKTMAIAMDSSGETIAEHTGPASNPSVVGAVRAREVVTDLLGTVLAQVGAREPAQITLLCMAGNRDFWRETANEFSQGGAFGRVRALDDAWPVLELATRGHRGLVLHAGTGSFIAARTPDGTVHYAGGLGWRFGDPGSGYDIGRRAIAAGLLELQGWARPTRLLGELQHHTGLEDPAAITRFFYHDAEPNRRIAAFAPAVLRLAAEGDHSAHSIVVASVGELLHLAHDVAERLFPETPRENLRAGVSGRILTHDVVLTALKARTVLPLAAVTQHPIEGVRRLLRRQG